MVDPDVEVDGLDDKGKTLTLDGKSSLEWGVASFEAKNLDALIEELGYGGEGGKAYEVVTVEWSWAENLAAWLTSSVISGLLMSLGMLGIMIGLYTGGSPLPLGLGATCLVAFFFGHHLVNLAGIEDMLLFLVGVTLVGVEVFLPGHIFPGVFGLLCIVAALFLGLVDFDKVDFDVQWQAGYVPRAITTVFGSIFATIVLGLAAFKFLPATRFGRGLLLSASIDARAADKVAGEAETVVGEVGVVETDLRPAGKVKIGDRRYEAVAERGYLEAGTDVRVVRRDGFHIVVAALKEEPK
jgi:membrane-bound serine protease (ClpP class)